MDQNPLYWNLHIYKMLFVCFIACMLEFCWQQLAAIYLPVILIPCLASSNCILCYYCKYCGVLGVFLAVQLYVCTSAISIAVLGD